jgi:AraC-like DNA-binding protein
LTFLFNLYSAPLLFGFVQAWLYAILLWVRGWQQERLSDILLGWVLVGCSFHIWEYMLGFGGIEVLWQELEFFPRSLGFLFPPLCYFYLKSQFNTTFRFSRKDLWHALPFLLDSGYHIIVFLQGAQFVENWKMTVHDPLHVPDVTFVAYSGWSVLYLIKALRLYRQYRSWSKTQFSDPDNVSYRWFRNFLLAMLVSLLVGLTMTLLDFLLDLTFWQEWWDRLLGAFLIYYLSINGYAQPARELSFQPHSREIIPEPAGTRTDPAAVQAPAVAVPEEIRVQLLSMMMVEKPYLEPQLSLSDLARRLQISPSVLSQVINSGAGKNFNDFINAYRVEEFKRQVHQPGNAHLSLLGIALNCGFNSKATFNRAFRKATGVSPSEFIARSQNPAEGALKLVADNTDLA